MNAIDLEILIPASPDFIWRFLGDLAQSVEWQEGVKSISFLTTQREGRGTRWRYATNRGNDVIVEVTAWYDTLGYEYKVVDGAGFGENQGRIRLHEVTDGTLVRWTFNYELSGMLGGLRNVMRHKRGASKQIQESLRNLHRQVLKESGGISTHQARANVREAPDVDERSIYTPRHPSSYIDPTTDTEKLLEEDMPMPLMFEYELASAAPTSAPEMDTKPNPVVQTGDISPEADVPQAKVEEATQPIAMEIVAYEPQASSEVEEAPSAEQEEEPAPEVSDIGPEPAPREARAVDTSGVSVFEIFGLRKPSEAGGQLLVDELAAERAELRRSAELPANLWVDKPTDDMAEQRNSGASAQESDRGIADGRFEERAGLAGQIVGRRRRTRMRQTNLRSHNR